MWPVRLGNFLQLAVIVSGFVFAAACQSSVPHARVPTGVERFDGADGSIRLVATGMASARAIEQDDAAMLQTTSREAARLLLLAELEKPVYSKLKGLFEMQDAEFIDRGRYCRLTTMYVPAKKIAPQGSRNQNSPTK